MIEVVGMGAAGWESLDEQAQDLVRRADLVVGGARHLDLLPPWDNQRRIVWPTDLRQDLPSLLSGHDQELVVALASGDPLVAGIGSTLIEVFGAEQLRIHPAVSSVALARARMGWSDDTAEVIRLRGEDVDQIRRWLFPVNG